MKLNRKVEYALMALNYMHTKKPGELTSAKELVAQFSISFDLISRVLQRLAAQKILRSVQGAHGGYQIIRDLREVSFYQLNSMLTESLGLAPCMIQDGKACEIMSTCNIKTPIQKLNERLKAFYQELSLAELLNHNSDFSEFDDNLKNNLANHSKAVNS